MRELVGSKNTIGQMSSVLKKLQKATFTFTLTSSLLHDTELSERLATATGSDY